MASIDDSIEVFRQELLSAFMEAGKHERETIQEMRAWRTSFPVGILTLITAVTPYAQDYITIPWIFVAAYLCLSIATLGLISSSDLVLQSDIRGYKRFQDAVVEIRAEVKRTKDLEAGMKKLKGIPRGYGPFFSYLSDGSMYLFIVALALLFASVFPSRILQPKNESLDKVVAESSGAVRVPLAEVIIKPIEREAK